MKYKQGSILTFTVLTLNIFEKPYLSLRELLPNLRNDYDIFIYCPKNQHVQLSSAFFNFLSDNKFSLPSMHSLYHNAFIFTVILYIAFTSSLFCICKEKRNNSISFLHLTKIFNRFT